MQRLSSLEQNYRSTNNILEAANAVIANNAHRKEKHLWSENGEGKEVSLFHYETAYGEAEDVIDKIQTSVIWESTVSGLCNSLPYKCTVTRI